MTNNYRVTSLYSGLDTQSIVNQMLSKHQNKIDKVIKQKEKIKYQMDEWKEVNSKIYDFYTKTLFDAKLKGSYEQTKTTSNSNAISIISNNSKNIGMHSITIESIAKAGYATSKKLNFNITNNSNIKQIFNLANGEYKFNNHSIHIDDSTTIGDLTKQLNECNVIANYDEQQHRFYISAKNMGSENDFDLSKNTSNEILNILGLNNLYYLGQDGNYYKDATCSTKATNEDIENIKNGNYSIKVNGENSKIYLNGVLYENNSNNYNINGLEFTVNRQEKNPITLSTTKDVSNIKSIVKTFIEEYNSIMEDLLTRYNEKNEYEPLLEVEKDEMSDREIEKWEDKVQKGCLSRNSEIQQLIQSFRNVMTNGIEMDNGEKMYLSNFGINTNNYFSSGKTQRNSYKIDEEKLEQSISNNEEKTIEFFTKLAHNLYESIGSEMKKTNYSSMYKVYDDKKLSNDYENYNKQIEKMEKRLYELEDKYYKQFTAMEVSLSKMQNNYNAISSLFTF